MVKTRRGTGTDTPGETPRSSAKKGKGKRELKALGIEESPTGNKRRRKSGTYDEAPVEEQASGTVEKTTEPDPASEASDTVAVVVAIPVRTKTRTESPKSEELSASSRRDSSPKVVINRRRSLRTAVRTSPIKEAHEQNGSSTQLLSSHTQTTNRPGSPHTTPAGTHQNRGSPLRAAKVSSKKSTPVSTKKASKRSNKDGLQHSPSLEDDTATSSQHHNEIPSSTWDSDQAPITTIDLTPMSTSTPKVRKTYKRFGSEEALETPNSITMNRQGHVRYLPELDEAQLDDAASDSDEAPDVVTASTAVSKVKAAQEEAARAQRAQNDREDRRKQQRADRMVEEQAEKRKRDEKKAKILAKQRAKDEHVRPRKQALSPAAALDVRMSDVPALLPTSILEAAGDHRPPTPPPVRSGKTAEEARKQKLNHHIKFLEHGEKAVKDVKKGSVNVSVLTQQNMLLAPKVNRNTKNVREHWLKGRQDAKRGKKGKKVGFQKMERRMVGGGFLRNGDD